jgi:hypothetical protein
VKRYPGFWSTILIACCLCGVAGVAQAQVAVTVTSTVAISVSAGDTISNGGAFTVANTTGSNITISSINLSLSNSAVFASLTLTGQVPGTTSVGTLVSSPTSSTTFDFSSLPVLPNGETATFTLSGLASSSPVPTPTPASSSLDNLRGRTAYAGFMWPSPFSHAKGSTALLTAMALGMLLMAGKLRRRHLVLLALALVLAATEVGCGNSSTSGDVGSSTQTVETVTTSFGGTTTGLPASLGTITVQ